MWRGAFPPLLDVACTAASSTVVTMAAYATGAGSTSRESRDGAVRNGFFTAALLHHLLQESAVEDLNQDLMLPGKSLKPCIK